MSKIFKDFANELSATQEISHKQELAEYATATMISNMRASANKGLTSHIFSFRHPETAQRKYFQLKRMGFEIPSGLSMTWFRVRIPWPKQLTVAGKVIWRKS